MHPGLKRAAGRIAAVRSDRKGVAYLEFALSLPILLGASLLGIETVNLVMSYLRVSQIAMMTADNASRVRDSIDEGDIVELFTGAKMSGESLKFAEQGRIVLSNLEQSPDGARQWLRWQRCIGKKEVGSGYAYPRTRSGVDIKDGTEILATNRTDPSASPSHWQEARAIGGQILAGIGKPGQEITAPGGTAILIAEVAYDYQPVFFKDAMKTITIRSTSAFNVRQRADQLLHNAAKIQPMSCNRFTS